jgi:tetratricopeptide (TPR) repeat protein
MTYRGVTKWTASLDDDFAAEPLEPTPADGPAVANPVVGDCLNRYTLRERIGEGAMGEVFAAHDPELDRMVAIKVLKRGFGRASPKTRARFRREAQAMARLNHPNVVSVFDVGMLPHGVFVAMELVEGPTLADWMRAPHGWREVVALFVEAGRGLLAAHEAGLVHRDFKPSNVIVGKRVRVADFGLARAATDVPAEPAPATSSLAVDVSATGQLVGTPAYMAPEQLAGAPASPLSDQYAFAVALHETLYGVRPGAGAPAPLRNAPARLRAVIERALAREPQDRYPSMRELLVELARDPAWTRRLWLAAIAGLLLIGGVVALVRRNGQVRMCSDAGAPWQAAWNAPRRSGVRAAFSTGAVADHLLASLDRYGERWTQARTRACTEAHDGLASEATTDLRRRCLDQRLRVASELIAAVVTDGAATRLNVGDAVDRLPALEDCDDPREEVPRPADPQSRSLLTYADALLSQAWALDVLEQYERARPLANAAVEIGERTGYQPLLARALILRGECEDRSHDYAAALATQERAATAAALARDDAAVVEALLDRFLVTGDHLGRPSEALSGRRFIELALERAGQPPRQRAMWLHFLAILLTDTGDQSAALAAETDAVAIWNRTLPPGHAYLIDSLETLGNIEIARANYPRAESLLGQVLAAKIAARGEVHIVVADTLTNLGVLEGTRGNVPAAITYFERARAAAGGEPYFLGEFGLGQSWYELGRYATALGYLQTALPIAEHESPPPSLWVASTLGEIALVQLALGKVDDAAGLLGRAIDMDRATGAPDLVWELGRAARVAVRRGDRATAHKRLAETDEATARFGNTTSVPIPAANGGRTAVAVLAEAELAQLENGCRAARSGYAEARRLAANESSIALGREATIEGASCDIRLGRAADAVAALERVLDELERAGADLVAKAPVERALATARSASKSR